MSSKPVTNVPISQILKNKSTFEDEPKKQSREDWRKAKELEEARKAGTAPAAVDEEGKDINPHIPQYISSTPWYFDASGPTLKHQRTQPEKQKEYSNLDQWYKRGVDPKNTSTKFRKGACENCGAITHKKKDCVERPRKIGAKFNTHNLAPDEYLQPSLSLDYEGKRDHWNNYDTSEHSRTTVEEYKKIEEAKRKMRAEKLNAEDEEEDEQDSDKDEDKYVDEIDMPGTKVDSKQRITVRNLRIREDTAKYLRNLNPNSAYYDPKTRSMRDNPHEGTDKEVDYQGENFIRFSGDTQKHATAQLFAWDAHGKGVDVHLLAEPTKLEMLNQEYDKKRDELKDQARGSVIDKYGGKEYLQGPGEALLLAQTENYVEYSRSGKVIKGQERQVIRSRYEEDVYPMNHMSVWGSYYGMDATENKNKWGYQCCHSFIKNAYCTGEAGREALKCAQHIDPAKLSYSQVLKENQSQEAKTPADNSESENKSSDDCSSDESDEDLRTKTERKVDSSKKKNKRKKQKEKAKNKKKGKKRDEEDEDEDDLRKAVRAEEKAQKEAAKLLKMDERKRPYNSMYQVKEPTADEIEAFQIKRVRDEDPMANFIK